MNTHIFNHLILHVKSNTKATLLSASDGLKIWYKYKALSGMELILAFLYTWQLTEERVNFEWV